MRIISTNIGQPTTILWNNKKEQTGIFKYPVSEPLFLEKESVAQDTISNRKVHGGVHKACYLFSMDQYPYWKGLYPHLEWNWGMFGENLTIEGLDETQIRIGDIFRIGTALVQVSQSREPCYKLGVRFGNQDILRQFIDHGYSGAYVRILEEGQVRTGDILQLEQASENPLTVKQFFNFLFERKKNPDILQLAIANTALPERKRERLKKYL
ncbi:MOSC domain-containing protein [Ulvibacterium marinum]|uniref:MOSC domain-containing protein n=1 Tax=Ulvibacterium marinum TaxID=2419782 RepID=A0A3B0BX88_9FLAO|nr:MOSC domain-containing protein [Ulvibacterium marinum]RKN78125.1 MOSC domain-containing protein [Ulvibacterium marinum]